MTPVLIEDGPDSGGIWHYGDPLREQRHLAAGEAGVDLCHRPVFSISTPGTVRLASSLNAIIQENQARGTVPTPPISTPGTVRLAPSLNTTIQENQARGTVPTPPGQANPGETTTFYVVDANDHLIHTFEGASDGDTFWAHTEPGRLGPLLAWAKTTFPTAHIIDRRKTHVVVQPPGAARPTIIPTADAEAALGDTRAGLWAYEALRIERGEPRPFLDAGENPPLSDLTANLALLHLDGLADALPPAGAKVLAGTHLVGRMGTSARHWQLGPIGLALLPRPVPAAPLTVAGIAAAAQPLPAPAHAFVVMKNTGFGPVTPHAPLT